MNPQRYTNVVDTWGKNVDFLFYSDHEDIDKKIIKVSDRTDYQSNEEKHINIIQYVSDNITGYDWYFFCDDDTFVNTKKLESFVVDLDKNCVHGSLLPGTWSNDKSLNYCSGGAGYLLHTDTIKLIRPNVRSFSTGFADVTLGLILREMNIKSINYHLFCSQPPEYINVPVTEVKNYISFHYIKTYEKMTELFNNI